MANISGPKGPKETKPAIKPAGLGSPVADKTQKPEKVQESGVPDADAFVDAGGSGVRPEARELPTGQTEQKGGGVAARLQALGLRAGRESALVKGADTVKYSSVPGGRILHGSLTVESTRSLSKLEGVVRVTGDVTLQESILKSADLLVMRSLIEVGGRLTVEGNGALQLFDALENLERARGIYFGFNPATTRVSLPKFQQVDAAVIFEANAALGEIHMPMFTKGGLYVHVHDHPSLITVLMPAFAGCKGELSFLDNPRLITVRLASKDRPAIVGSLEVGQNGAASFPLLFARTATA